MEPKVKIQRIVERIINGKAVGGYVELIVEFEGQKKVVYFGLKKKGNKEGAA